MRGEREVQLSASHLPPSFPPAGKSSSKSQRMSTQVRRMLMKGKAGGRNSLHQDDRFYLEVRRGREGGGREGGGEGGSISDIFLFLIHIGALWWTDRWRG